MSIYDIAAENGISAIRLESRIWNEGWDPKLAASTPVRGYGNHTEWLERAQQNGISKAAYYGRLKRGWSQEDAVTQRMFTPAETLQRMHQTEPKRKHDPAHIKQAAQNGISANVFRSRRAIGWSIERAMTQPCRWGGTRCNNKGVMDDVSKNG